MEQRKISKWTENTKGRRERRRGDRRKFLSKGMFYGPSLSLRSQIHTTFEQHIGNGRKSEVM